jgi:hypothetical protein
MFTRVSPFTLHSAVLPIVLKFTPCCTGPLPYLCCPPTPTQALLRALCLPQTLTAQLTLRPRCSRPPPHTPTAIVPPTAPSPQLSSSDMSLQSGRRSQRYSNATHSLWLWQANSASVQTLGTWGTVEVGRSQRQQGLGG